MKNLYIVRTPLQLINAIEAKEHFHCTHNILVIIQSKTDKTQQHLEKLLSLTHWDEILTIKTNTKQKKSNFFQYVKYIKHLKKERFNFIFTGEFATIHQIFIANLNKKEVFLIDDGTLTISVHANNLHPNNRHRRPYSFRKLRYNIFGLKTHAPDTVHLFTTFKLTPHKKEKIVHNELNFFKKFLSTHTEDDNRLYFLGQSLVESGMSSRDDYIKYIQSIINYYKRPIIYIPHRAETLSDEILSLQSDNFTIKELSKPVELEFLENYRYPRHIASFFSTALYNINMIFPSCQVDAIVLDEKTIHSHKDTILRTYELFKSDSSIALIEL